MRLWGTKVLIFDDDRDLLHVLVEILRQEGGAPMHVTGAHEALATIIGVHPDLLLVAVDRPTLNAAALMCLVRTLSPEKGGRIPALSVASPHRPQWSWPGSEGCFQQHLSRPLQPEAFVTVASQLAGQWVERRRFQAGRAQWPSQVRLDRRREVRTELVTEGQRLAALRAGRRI